MPESMSSLAERLLSKESAAVYTSIEAGTPITAAQTRPYEPSTLLLAMVGIATVAIYLAAGGWRRARTSERAVIEMARSTPPKRRVTEAPRRGAA
jgi:hypothetical protein